MTFFKWSCLYVQQSFSALAQWTYGQCNSATTYGSGGCSVHSRKFSRMPCFYPPEASSSYSLPCPKFWQPHMSLDSSQQWGTVGIQEEGTALCSYGSTFIVFLITGQKNLRSSFAEGYQKLPNTRTVKVTDYLLTLWIKVAGKIINTITLYGEMTWLWLLFSSPFWSFHLPMTAKWSFTVNLHFLYNDFFSFFSLFFSSPRHKR